MMNLAITNRNLFLIVIYVFSIYSQDYPMKFLGVRTYFYFTGYNGVEFAKQYRCCNLSCAKFDYNILIYFELSNKEVKSGYRTETTGFSKGQEWIYVEHAVDYPPELINSYDELIFSAYVRCENNWELDRWYIHKLEYYPFNGTSQFKTLGQNNVLFLTFGIKGNCPGRGDRRCKKPCIEDEDKYCDEFTGIFFCKNKKFGATCEFQQAACNRNPCRNGICENVGAGFRCHCQDGFTGDTCRDITCTSSTCKNGVCVNKRVCSCFDGYSGTNCENLVSSLSFCSGRGTAKILPDKTNYICNCFEDASGVNCEYSCGGACRNGGKCVVRRNSGYCECAPSYIGKNCEFKEGQGVCSTINCQNGGECIKVGTNDFKCTCSDLWYGSFCETSICLTDYCYHGNCLDNYGCVCYDGYSGKRCDEVNIQLYYECQNGGVRRSDFGFLRCDCEPKTTTGPFCEYTCPKRCVKGECQWSNSVIKCVCERGYSGEDCSILKDTSVCAKHPCLNGGECKELPGGKINCTCKNHWTGDICEKSTCQSNLCFRGTCIDGVGCVCFKGYKGISCNEPVCPSDGSLCSRQEECSIVGSRVFCNCDRQRYYGQKCERECEPACSKNGVCGLLDGELKCICFANYKGEKCDKLIVDPAYLYSIYGCTAAIIILVVSSVALIYLTMKHKLHFTSQAIRNALFDASSALGFTRAQKVVQVDDTYGSALQKGWAISSR